MIELLKRILLKDLEREDAELADKLRVLCLYLKILLLLMMYLFKEFLEKLKLKILSLALKGCSEEVANAIYRNQSKRAAASLKEDMEFLGPVRLIDVEKAQQKIVAIIRRLDEAGEIIISRGGEDALIV